MTSKPRGLAALTPEQRAAISSKGGRAAQAKGTAHRFTWAEACKAGRLGGIAVSRDPERMAAIGRKGGLTRAANARQRAEAAAQSPVDPIPSSPPTKDPSP
jgi:uncharacterized protein